MGSTRAASPLGTGGEYYEFGSSEELQGLMLSEDASGLPMRRSRTLKVRAFLPECDARGTVIVQTLTVGVCVPLRSHSC